MDERVRRALDLMEKDYARPLTVSQLAKGTGLSRSRFEHLFGEAIGLTFAAKLREIRLTEAAGRLLSERTLSVKQVAFLSGYSSTPTFIRNFKKRFGRTPSNFRRSTSG